MQAKKSGNYASSQKINNKKLNRVKTDGKKTAGQKPERRKGALFFNLFVVAVIIICILGVLNNHVQISQRSEQLEELEQEYNSLRIKNDEIRNRLEINRSRVLDEDYIINFARTRGLRRNNEILFYLHPEQ